MKFTSFPVLSISRWGGKCSSVNPGLQSTRRWCGSSTGMQVVPCLAKTDYVCISTWNMLR
jgi:hypothetical protein